MKNITIKSLREKQKDFFKPAERFFQKPKSEAEEFSGKTKKASKIKKCANFIFFFLFVLIIGGIGGIFMDRFVIPQLLARYPELGRYEFLKNVSEHTTIVEITKEVKISEDRAVVEAIKKVAPSIVEIVEPAAAGKLTEKGPGLILTSDGFIITSIKNITSEETSEEQNRDKKKEKKNVEPKVFKTRTKDGRLYDIKFVNKDLLTGLAIVKMDKSDLSVTAFADSSLLDLGEKLIVINSSLSVGIVSKFINDYTFSEEKQKAEEKKMPPAAQKRIIASFDLDSSFSGATVVNIKGEVVGISQEENLIVPINEIKKFIEESIKQ